MEEEEKDARWQEEIINQFGMALTIALSGNGIDYPYVTGNTINSVNMDRDGNITTITIDPKKYDIDIWKQYQEVVFISDDSYAYAVNYETGGWSKKHKNWIEINITALVNELAAALGAEVINETNEQTLDELPF